MNDGGLKAYFVWTFGRFAWANHAGGEHHRVHVRQCIYCRTVLPRNYVRLVGRLWWWKS